MRLSGFSSCLKFAFDQFSRTKREGGEEGGHETGDRITQRIQFKGGRVRATLAGEQRPTGSRHHIIAQSGQRLLTHSIGTEEYRVFGHIGHQSRSSACVQTSHETVFNQSLPKAFHGIAIQFRKGLHFNL
jgi:hypothetical protein